MTLLEARGVTKRFAGISALDDVSITVEQGEAVGLIGPNGAGKTTLFNCVLGMLRPDRGAIVLEGRDVTHMPVYRRARLGIGRTFQRLELFGGMTVRDHLFVADWSRLGTGRLWKDCLNLSKPTVEQRARVDRTLSLLGLDGVADRPVESLSLGLGRAVELARALMTEPLLLLLDEPSSGLDQQETKEIVQVLQDVQAERGTAVLLVEHDIEMVHAFASRVCVLESGTLIAQGPTALVMADDAVRRAYLGGITAVRPEDPGARHGTQSEQEGRRPERTERSPLLQLREVDAGYGGFRAVFGVSFSIEEGGVTALLGANGAGKTTVRASCPGSSRLRRAKSSSTASRSPGCRPGGSRRSASCTPQRDARSSVP